MNNTNYNNRQSRPRNEAITFNFIDEFTNTRGEVIDSQEVFNILGSLYEDGIFKILSIPVSTSRSLMFDDPERKGTMSVGYVNTIDVSEKTMSVMIFSSHVERIKTLIDEGVLVVRPKILVDKEGNITTFLNFEIVEG